MRVFIKDTLKNIARLNLIGIIVILALFVVALCDNAHKGLLIIIAIIGILILAIIDFKWLCELADWAYQSEEKK